MRWTILILILFSNFSFAGNRSSAGFFTKKEKQLIKRYMSPKYFPERFKGALTSESKIIFKSILKGFTISLKEELKNLKKDDPWKEIDEPKIKHEMPRWLLQFEKRVIGEISE